MSETWHMAGPAVGKIVAAAAVGGLIGGFLAEGTPLQRAMIGVGGFLSAVMLYPIGAALIGAGLNIILPDKWMPPIADLHAAGGFALGLAGIWGCAAFTRAMRRAADRVEEIVDDRLDRKED